MDPAIKAKISTLPSSERKNNFELIMENIENGKYLRNPKLLEKHITFLKNDLEKKSVKNNDSLKEIINNLLLILEGLQPISSSKSAQAQAFAQAIAPVKSTSPGTTISSSSSSSPGATIIPKASLSSSSGISTASSAAVLAAPVLAAPVPILDDQTPAVQQAYQDALEKAPGPMRPNLNAATELTTLASAQAAPINAAALAAFHANAKYKTTYTNKIKNYQKGNFQPSGSIDPVIIQAESNAARNFIPFLGTTSPLRPMMRKPTLAQGDCFYSSIFRSSRERGLLHNLIACLGLQNVVNEATFVQALRNKVAAEIRKGKSGAGHVDGAVPGSFLANGQFYDIYDILLLQFINDYDAFLQIIQPFPFWFAQKYKKLLDLQFPSRDDFYEEYAQHTEKPQEYVATIEVTITERLLKENCGIGVLRRNILDVLTDPMWVSQGSEIVNGMPTLYLVNLGEGHWEYDSFDLSNPRKPLPGLFPDAYFLGGKPASPAFKVFPGGARKKRTYRKRKGNRKTYRK